MDNLKIIHNKILKEIKEDFTLKSIMNSEKINDIIHISVKYYVQFNMHIEEINNIIFNMNIINVTNSNEFIINFIKNTLTIDKKFFLPKIKKYYGDLTYLPDNFWDYDYKLLEKINNLSIKNNKIYFFNYELPIINCCLVLFDNDYIYISNNFPQKKKDIGKYFLNTNIYNIYDNLPKDIIDLIILEFLYK